MKRRKGDWQAFESEVRGLVEAFGYRAQQTQLSHDFGVDVIGENSRRRVVIQCKLYGGGRIGGDTIMHLVGSRQYHDATDAICITTSRFTKQARQVAEKETIRLIDREMLLKLCQERKLTIPSLTVMEVERTLYLTTDEPVSFGREEGSRVLLRDPLVSRRHAQVARKGLTLILEDLGSSNGTLLNGAPVTIPLPISYGDAFQLGTTTVRVLMQVPDGTLVGEQVGEKPRHR